MIAHGDCWTPREPAQPADQRRRREGRAFFRDHPNITGSELYAFSSEMARRYGWEYGGPHCGHLIGNFRHEKIQATRSTTIFTRITTGAWPIPTATALFVDRAQLLTLTRESTDGAGSS
jgi:hypothetical protein